MWGVGCILYQLVRRRKAFPSDWGVFQYKHLERNLTSPLGLKSYRVFLSVLLIPFCTIWARRGASSPPSYSLRPGWVIYDHFHETKTIRNATLNRDVTLAPRNLMQQNANLFPLPSSPSSLFPHTHTHTHRVGGSELLRKTQLLKFLHDFHLLFDFLLLCLLQLFTARLT